MYYFLFRWFPKRGFSRCMGWLADRAWPRPVMAAVIGLYRRVYRIDMADFATPPGGFRTFTAFFTRGLRPGARPVTTDAAAIVSPVDGAVVEAGAIREGRLLQAKGHAFSLEALLGGDANWRAYEGGSFITLYLSPRDYHRIHTPCAGSVTRFRHVPGDLWTVGPAGVNGVPGLFARNERLISFLDTALGEVAVVKVGATVVGRVKVVYHDITTNRPGQGVTAETIAPPHALAAGAELGRFELGSTVILLLPPGTAALEPFASGDTVRMGQTIGHRA
jgi:phosphatidylserine decarboxylase